jgi:hypothetical protein
MRRRLLPFEQGHLDGLCGLYSVVNATRFALSIAEFPRPYRSPAPCYLNLDEAELLFTALVRGLAQSPRRTVPFADGINSRELTTLLRLADTWLRKWRAVRLFVTRPLYRCGRIRTKTILRRISSHLAEPGTAVIVGANPPWRHWTVATRVASSRVYLLDSCGHASIPLRLNRHSKRYHAGLIKPAEVYLVAIAPTHQ